MKAPVSAHPVRLWAIRALNATFTGSCVLRRVRQVASDWSGGRRLRLGVSLLLDLVLGYLCATLVWVHWIPPQRLVEGVLTAMDGVVFYLRQLIAWLMDAPAGLKLNSVLSSALGRFFMYHIHLWVTFLYLATPLVSEALSQGMGILTYTGLWVQVSVAQDTFNLVTFHVHCFYAYARRLCLSQSHGLQSLWRLFRGKKYNPLRDRVDTSRQSVDQLFVGTLAFTILLFLYPTTLMYFAVFKCLDLAITVVNWGLASLVTLGLSAV
eukprot:snap_masked-scaffold1028_size131186-processed-gene-0.13 protein:Tk10626 transcript:snap_masked-scaffold1028_size131186-processed-gene-0.13-mRNA-1 annotation:"low quality protein: phosphatidylinositol glycan anchor class q"